MSDLNFALLGWQQKVIADKTRFKVVVAGRRCGKSRLAAVTLIIEALQCPQGSGVMYVAPTQGQARVIIWNVLMEIGREVIASAHVNNSEITLVNGAVIYVRGADRPDTLRGVSLSYCVLDEYADMKPSAWEQVIRASLADKRGRAMFIGTPKGRNHFYDIFKMGEDDSKPEWASWSFTTADNELIHPDEIAEAKRTMSSFAFKQEFMASFDNSGTDLFKEEWIKYGKEPTGGLYFMAVDLAGFEAVATQAGNAKARLDQTAISIVKVTDEGKWFVKKIEYGRWDVRETAVRILKNIREYRPIATGIEKGSLMNAVMPYLSDLMRKHNTFSHIQHLTHGNRTKYDRIIWALQGMFEHGRIILNIEEDWDVFKDQLLMFPSKGVHDDLCFPGETMIQTANGEKPISEVTINDYVVTRQGLKRVLKAWCKGTKKVITRYGIEATPDHLIFTMNKGWVRLDSLTDDDTIVTSTIKESTCESRSFLMEEHTIDIQMQNNQIIGDTSLPMQNGKKHQDRSIEISGNSTMEQSQTDTTSTTLMVTAQTTISQILNAFPPLLTKSNMQKNEANEVELQSVLNNSQELEILLKHGIVVQKVGSGIENMQNEVSQKTYRRSAVLSAESLLSRKSQSKCSVERLNATTFDKPELQERSVPVYDLMVEDCHEFFANGVLAHNCDSLAYIAQMAVTSYRGEDDDSGYDPIDIISGL